MDETVCIIPARGGSKGIPRKNLIPLCGRPLLAWSIEAAGSARSIDHVFVSTEDEEISKIAHKEGADIITRPAELATDKASGEAVLLHALEHLSQKNSIEPEILVFLQCTSPLTLATDIDDAVEKFHLSEADSLFMAAAFHGFLWQEQTDGTVKTINHDSAFRPLRQDLDNGCLLETGAGYVLNCEGFKKARHRFFGKIVCHALPSERSVDIDDPVDLLVAEALLAELLKKSSAS